MPPVIRREGYQLYLPLQVLDQGHRHALRALRVLDRPDAVEQAHKVQALPHVGRAYGPCGNEPRAQPPAVTDGSAKGLHLGGVREPDAQVAFFPGVAGVPLSRAEVSIADASPSRDVEPPVWKPAGIWYLAGSNTCVYSNPKDELGATEHVVQTSNRRFRDDEFIIPRDLTRRRSAIRVRIKFTPVKIPLFPGHPLPELAWSELRYDAYCWVMPASSP